MFLKNDERDQESVPAENLYLKSYNMFCKDIIEENILRKHKVYRLSKLCEKFISYVSMNEQQVFQIIGHRN